MGKNRHLGGILVVNHNNQAVATSKIPDEHEDEEELEFVRTCNIVERSGSFGKQRDPLLYKPLASRDEKYCVHRAFGRKCLNRGFEDHFAPESAPTHVFSSCMLAIATTNNMRLPRGLCCVPAMRPRQN